MPAKKVKVKEPEASRIRSMLIRLTEEQAEQLEKVAAKVPFASRSAVALEAMRIGLALVDRDPSWLLSRATPESFERRLAALEAAAEKGKKP